MEVVKRGLLNCTSVWGTGYGKRGVRTKGRAAVSRAKVEEAGARETESPRCGC